MSSELQSGLSGALSHDAEMVFADYPAQLAALQQSSVVCSLSQFRLLRVTGEEAGSFLQGQLSNDVRLLNGSNAQYTGYSSAKGRLLASFLLWQFGEDYYLLVASDLAETIARRLAMFILRSKVKLTICDDWVLSGLNGADAESWLSQQGHVIPESPLQLTAAVPGTMLLRLRHGALLLLSPAQGGVVLPQAGLPVEPEVWSLLDIAAGVPWISLAVQDEFVGQMVNLDLIDAISFTKGCYPGQEIIARTRYLGKIKRRMLKIRLPGEAVSGAPLYCQSMGDQSVGTIVNVAREQPGFSLALAVIQLSTIDEGIYLDKALSQKIEIQSLPYSVSDE
ncbi:folate-binding protein YgfZ [Paludibacterium sp. B53371]|uniref:CAF17-like 4Fe-4S cluster assembly/insertion protein YgfZ n=1 Tax=Paludibacterium sp. B53371 TaxID=2806263 RepID=UPI001C05281C|nr:hypothetical protein [Paludibacterium sp. B53371]